MLPKLPIPTDHFWKFMCLMGLFAVFVSYAGYWVKLAQLDESFKRAYIAESVIEKNIDITDIEKIKYQSDIALNERIRERFEDEKNQLKRFLIFGLLIFILSSAYWLFKIDLQMGKERDLHNEKLKYEIEKLKSEIKAMQSNK